ncbi:ChaN family lipoprotein [Roseibium sp. RKSG952]|uniref:ChaN family lipoprotein n=1 Tax=Roseibium sp. RKSG952 TaxID=2529384 RepID=UPI0012BC784A|nr:ChaN family lipoprotein [Roseibium sp. RKSG952]MTI00329.1 hypothetical protein [Roseibium sp. RKSG952]
MTDWFRTARRSFLAATLCTLAAVALLTPSAQASWKDWAAGDVENEVAAGRIWSVADQVFLSPEELISRLSEARFVLLGEVHDNPDHHQLQGYLIGRIAPNQRPAVVMEMLSEDQEEALSVFDQLGEKSSGIFAEQVDWAGSGWPGFDLYRPVVDAALARNVSISAGLPGRQATRSVSAAGLVALDGGERARLGLTDPLSPRQAAGLRAEIMASHCDLLPVEAIPNMSAVQRFRDAYLADALRQTPATGPAVLVAGKGHVRKDRGVPRYLKDANGSVATVMFEEVPENTTLAAVAGLFPRDTPADYIWLTRSIERDDPCLALKNRFSGSGKP